MVEGETIDIEANSGDIPLVQTLANRVDGSNQRRPVHVVGAVGQWAARTPRSKRRACFPGSTWRRCRSRSITATRPRRSRSASTPRSSGTGNVTLASTSTADAEGAGDLPLGHAVRRGRRLHDGGDRRRDERQQQRPDRLDRRERRPRFDGQHDRHRHRARQPEHRHRPGQPERHRDRPGRRRGQSDREGHGLPGATVMAAGDVNLTATGNAANTAIPTTGTYVSGMAGVAVGVNVTENTIKANDDGTMISGASATAPALTARPRHGRRLRQQRHQGVPPANMASLQTGQPYIYSSGDNGADRRADLRQTPTTSSSPPPSPMRSSSRRPPTMPREGTSSRSSSIPH